VLTGYPGPWWVVGGRAIEAFTRVPRPHEDIDIALPRADLPRFREHVADRFHVWVNQSGSLTPLLPGEPDTYPPDFLQVWLRRDAASPWEFDMLFDPAEPGCWVNRRWPSMVLPLEEATWVGATGVRYLNPEIVLLFKARAARAKDEADLQATLPMLTAQQRGWLRGTLAMVHPGHRWLTRLTESNDSREHARLAGGDRGRPATVGHNGGAEPLTGVWTFRQPRNLCGVRRALNGPRPHPQIGQESQLIRPYSQTKTVLQTRSHERSVSDERRSDSLVEHRSPINETTQRAVRVNQEHVWALLKQNPALEFTRRFCRNSCDHCPGVQHTPQRTG
jgi:hypothetical protein